jgi:hypothetical protein
MYVPGINGEIIKGPHTWFLVLRKCPGTEDTFERIGVGMAETDGEGSLFHNAGSSTVTII